MLELPNWEHWGRMRDITLREALVLSINLCPNSYNHENNNEMERQYAEKYWQHLQIAKSHIYDSEWLVGRVARSDIDIDVAHTAINLQKFCCWAVEDVQLADLPYEMRVLGEELLVSIADPNEPIAEERIVAPPQKSTVACTVILNAMKQLGYDPLSLPQNMSGKKGVKSKVRKHLEDTPLFRYGSVFDNAWTKLLNTEQIRYA
jgi:hypothetical protein